MADLVRLLLGKRVRVFKAVAVGLSFTKAGEELHMTQP